MLMLPVIKDNKICPSLREEEEAEAPSCLVCMCVAQFTNYKHTCVAV